MQFYFQTRFHILQRQAPIISSYKVSRRWEFTFIFFSLRRGDDWRVIKQSSTFRDYICNFFIKAINHNYNTMIKTNQLHLNILLSYYVNLTDWLTTSYWQTGWLNSSNWLNYFCIWQTNTSLWLYESDWSINFWLNEWPHVKDCIDLTDYICKTDYILIKIIKGRSDWLTISDFNL